MQPIELETRLGPIVVRQGTLADVVQFRDLRLDALQDSPTAFPVEYSVYVNHPISFWEDRIKPNENGILFFAEHDDQLVGMMGIRRGETPKTSHGAIIWGVYVRPAWRGLHLCKTLIQACLQWAKGIGVNIVKLGVSATGTSAIRGYQRSGFTIYATEPRDLFYNGQYYDGYLMYRYLDKG